MKMPFMCAFWAIVFINFLVELYLEEEYFTLMKELKPTHKNVSFDIEDSFNDDVRIAGNR
jgi:hypothetical protein